MENVEVLVKLTLNDLMEISSGFFLLEQEIGVSVNEELFNKIKSEIESITGKI